MTSIDQAKFDDERNVRMLEMHIKQFLERWTPDNRRPASDFHCDLMMLVRAIYQDAQAPLIKQLTTLMTAMPLYANSPPHEPTRPDQVTQGGR